MVAACAAVELGRILKHLQIIGYRDHWQKNHDEHCQRGELRPGTGAVAARMTQPESHKQDRQQSPDEIECQLHLHL
jgi:hypothetical protein